MATVNPKVIGYVMPHLREKFERFRQEEGYTSDSKALNGLLESFFDRDRFKSSTDDTEPYNTSSYATAAELEELRAKISSLTDTVAELYQVLELVQSNNTQSLKSPTPPKLSSQTTFTYSSSMDSDTLGRLYAASLDISSDSNISLALLSQTIDSLEADIEDRLFAIWQGIAIRQVGDNFYGHLVPLDLIHELGFQSMPMSEFLDYLANTDSPGLELVSLSQNDDYTVGSSSAWSLTFRNHT